MIAASETPKDNPLDHLSEEQVAVIAQHVKVDDVKASAIYDLDDGGKYVQAHLVLTADRLGNFVHRDGKWDARWTSLKDMSHAKIIDGLGMGMLRTLKDGTVLGEFRFSLRHARQVAKLQRNLERFIEGRETDDTVAEAPRPDEKKSRCDKCGRVIPAWSEFCPACLSRRTILFRLLDFVKAYKLRAVWGILLASAITLLGLGQPYLVKPIINQGLGGDHGEPNFRILAIYVGIMAGLQILLSIGRAVQMRTMALLGSRITRNVRLAVYEHLHKLSLSFFARKQTGGLVTRITSDSDRIWDFIAFTVIDLAMAFLTLVGVAAALFCMQWKLAIFVLLPVPLMIAMMMYFHKRLHGIFDRLWHRWSQMTSVIADALPGVRVIKAFSQERREVHRFRRRSFQVYMCDLEAANVWTLFGPVMNFCTQLGVILVWLVGGYLAIESYQYQQIHHAAMPGGMDIGTLFAFTMYMSMFYGPVHMIAHMDRALNRAATSAQRVFEILDTEPTIYSKRAALEAKEIVGRIELRNVSFSYDGIRKVLKNVNLVFEPGKMVGLAGPSGGGKTTMINLICRFYDVLEGQILIDGVDIRDYHIESLRRHVGVVLQEPFLFHGTVGQNVAYGHPDATIEQIIAASRAANAHDFIVGFPDGYDTMVGERGHTLSGGERQRISIARAVLSNPRVLILDEATSSVDTETEKLIQEALDRLVANRTTIAIAHRLSTLRKADSLVVLDKGEVVDQGTHEELAHKDGCVYAKLLRLQNEMQSIMAIG